MKDNNDVIEEIDDKYRRFLFEIYREEKFHNVD